MSWFWFRWHTKLFPSTKKSGKFFLYLFPLFYLLRFDQSFTSIDDRCTLLHLRVSIWCRQSRNGPIMWWFAELEILHYILTQPSQVSLPELKHPQTSLPVLTHPYPYPYLHILRYPYPYLHILSHPYPYVSLKSSPWPKYTQEWNYFKKKRSCSTIKLFVLLQICFFYSTVLTNYLCFVMKSE